MNIRICVLTRYALLAVMSLMTTPVLPDNGLSDPEQLVRETVDGVIARLHDPDLSPERKAQSVRNLISQSFDYDLMASRVLATNWNRALPGQRQRFTLLFRDLLTHTYWQKISQYSGESVDYLESEARSGRYATVRTVIRTSTVDIPVDYKLAKQNDSWVGYDVVIEQVSLVRNYRGEYQTLVKKLGIDGLLRHLENQVQAFD